MFCKFPSITNSYHEKTLSFWLEKRPELKNERFTAELKLDGSNITFLFSRNQEMKVFSREQRIGPDQNFFDVWNVIKDKKYQDFFTFCQKTFDTFSGLDEIQITGELYGKGVQKRINYGDEKHIKFFSVRLNDILQDPAFCYTFIPTDLLIHIENDNLTLAEALSFDVTSLKDYESPTNDSAEGIVIKPYNKVYVSPVGEIFYLKKKSEKFKDRAKVKEEVLKQSDDVVKLNILYKSFLTENRLLDIFSKYNKINNQSELGTYIKLFREDAINDFMKDYKEEFNKLDKKEQKAVFNVGNTIAKMFQKYLHNIHKVN